MIKSDLPEGCEQVSPLLDLTLPSDIIRFRYRNWEGKEAVRTVRPQRMFIGTSKWHPGAQLLLLAEDLDRQAPRCFAVRDILEFLEATPEAPAEQEEIRQPVATSTMAQSRVQLFQDPGSGRMVHNGEPSWRAVRQMITDLDDTMVTVKRTADEVTYHAPSGIAIAGVSLINGEYLAMIEGFEFWSFSKKERRGTYQMFIKPSSIESGEELITTILRQAGAIIP